MNAQWPAPPQPPRQASGAVAALVLGILSVVFCPLCGPVAWSLGRKAEQEVDASGQTLSGRGLATAGKILGIIGTLLIAGLILLIVLGIALGGDGPGTTRTYDY